MPNETGRKAAKPQAAAPVPAPTARLAGLDIARGLSIAAVVLHHVTGAGLAVLPHTGLAFWPVLLVNRATQFVVPTFLLLTALVFALSMRRPMVWRRYAQTRARQLLWPYLLWTALYLGFQQLTVPGGPPLTLNHYLTTGLLSGKGYFHLYYLLVALQVVVLLPLVRGWPWGRWGLGATLLGGAAAQLGAYLLNLRVLHLHNVGSSVLWYLLPLSVGLGLGAVPGRLEGLWARHRRWLLTGGVAAFVVYLPFGLAEVLGGAVLTRALPGFRFTAPAYSAANWLFTTTAAIVVAGLGVQLTRAGRLAHGLERLGQLSLQVYLLHPALLWALEAVYLPTRALPHLAVTVLYTVLGVVVPLAVASLLEGRRASVWLFGR